MSWKYTFENQVDSDSEFQFPQFQKGDDNKTFLLGLL